MYTSGRQPGRVRGVRERGYMKIRDQDLSRRQLLRGSTVAVAGAAIAGALLIPRGRSGTVPWPAPSGAGEAGGGLAAEASGGPLLAPLRRTSMAPRRASSRPAGATVNPRAYGIPYRPDGYLRAAERFDSYVGLPLATTIQKIYLREGQYYTDPLPLQITTLAGAGCQFIICIHPSRTTDQRTQLARFLWLLNSHGIVYQAAMFNEWNYADNFASAQDYLSYWSHYAPVVKAAGVPLCNLVAASSNKTNYAKILAGFPVNPRPDRYWIDYYATAYRWNLRLDARGGLLDQADSLGVPAGIGEFGIGAHGVAPMSVWDEFCHYLAGLAPRLPLGCVYWGSVNDGRQNVVTGPRDPKVPGIRQVMEAFRSSG
jgi:hypothetical protein